MKHKDESAELTVIARNPFHIYYEGPARMVSASNEIGDFDILPGHADFFSVMVPGEVTIETAADSIRFNIHNGIISVRQDEAILFINI